MHTTSGNQQQHGRQQDGQQQQDRPPDEGPPFWEWVVAAIGLALLLASIGYLLYDGWLVRGQEPAPSIRVQAVEEQGSRYVVRLQVRNDSRATAASLRIEGELKRDGEVVERSELEFDYLPGQSSRDGALLFSQDPRTLQLELSARSYERP